MKNSCRRDVGGFGPFSIYGDSEALPKVEESIGRPLSVYAITKYVNELYAHVFAQTCGMVMGEG